MTPNPRQADHEPILHLAMAGRDKASAPRSRHRFLPVRALPIFVCILLLLTRPVFSADGDEEDDFGDTGSDGGSSFGSSPQSQQILTELIYNQFANFTSIFRGDISKNFGFCIQDTDADWNGAFNFSSNPGFLTACVKATNGQENIFVLFTKLNSCWISKLPLISCLIRDMTKRMCTAADIKFYFNSFFSSTSSTKKSSYLKPNKNCNLTSWVPGCEPGWACSAGPDQKVDLKESKEMLSRTTDCKPCCEGFFCPHGLTCMIPCPLGSYCPLAKLNKTSGVCEPYLYQLPHGETNHTCGGADVWADVISSSEVFCSAGSYCPTTVQKISCSRGHFCRTGSTAQQGPCHQERRQAKSREKAVQSVRETAQAREKWKSAKDTAKKHAVGLQTQLSRTFSRRKSTNKHDLRGLSLAKHGNDPGVPSGGPLEQASTSSDKEKKDKSSNLTKMMQAIEDDPESNEGFHVNIGDKNIKKQMPRGKQLHTHSQIFKYAYGQIEKEKQLQEQNKNLTFSGIISIAADLDITGKATGCTVSGTILINGKDESIHSYKKIIGFVPQDDIVHGNLTVEENLWFSARCRLSADLPKPEKVLVVERVIESLGLQQVRDSLVGTVEKRGISGGQRKRVNVGLEMVMEPSLLILDEPTSGLDSSSSLLLLRALRREALEGVNISMVVHQPRQVIPIEKHSQIFIQMFDDLILLAKAVSPYTMDQPKSANVNYKQLPVRWMLHNNYPVPHDMLSLVDGTPPPTGDSVHGGIGSGEGQSFAGDLWQDVMFNVALRGDKIRHNFLKSQDLSARVTPDWFLQYKYFLGRLVKQRLREARIQGVDFIILLLAGVCLGTLAKVRDETFGCSRIHLHRDRCLIALQDCGPKIVYNGQATILERERGRDDLLCDRDRYTFAILFDPGPAQLWCVLLPVVLTLIATQDNDSKTSEFISDLCFSEVGFGSIRDRKR
ncbi:hypothetical protein MLD38_009586 [Melastoma candidum]|uniref:Uncharacterized protein n=1 Tax=Melastoma candidum TaxID=119954 RepID=A0ACB9RZX7_9MYRT|nr:hypothetical protein MLD38_009586 [Melastoma candidum]